MLKKHVLAPVMAILISIIATGCQYKGLNATELQTFPGLPDYSEYVTLGDYKGIEYTLTGDYEISEDDIDFSVETALYSLATYEIITDRGAEKGDLVTLIHSATVDGLPFLGGSSDENGTSIFLGYAGYIGDFEDQIVGMKTGEAKDISVEFPDDFNKISLRGKTAIYHVEITLIQERKMPEITDEMIATATGYSTIEEFRNVVRQNYEDSYEKAKYMEACDIITDKILENATIKSYPEDMLDALISKSISNIETAASTNGMSVDDFVSSNYDAPNMETYKIELTKDMQTFLAKRMIACEIARKENITITDEEFTEYKKQYAVENGYMNVDDVNIYYTDKELALDASLHTIEDWLINNAVEKTTE